MQRQAHLAGLLALLATSATAGLPYNPTRILLPVNASCAYIFRPSAQTAGQSELSVIRLNSGLTTTSDSHYLPISGTLPFLQDDELLPYTPFLDSSGNITVIAGNCSQGADGTQIWRFAADASSTYGNGTWSQYQTSEQELGSQAALAGPSYLANGIAFSEEVNGDASNTDIFVFGGMCPFANSTADTWTSAADYSNQMLTLTPDNSAGYMDYDVNLATSRGPPIAEAGFSITPLAATYSESTSGQPQKQQQDFVLLGGHTQTAFINMSQVALFSLPQESWTFLPVTQPSDVKTDLAARQAQAQVEPRSGHTAVLMEDGSSIVLFGGWVGDVNTPAQPQLAVLNLGSGFGGDGDWSWSIPSTTGPGLAADTGIYGHGAAVLPGGVMMVVGGYSISASPSKRSKRDGQASNAQMYFYNTTSNAWLDSYTPPASTPSAANQDGGPLGKTSQWASLGAGLGIGAAVLIGLVVFYFWYSRRLKHAREARGRALLSRSSVGSSGPISQPMAFNSGIDGRGSDTAAVGRFWNVWDQSLGAYPARGPQMQQAGTAGATGLFVNAPSPTRGLRKGLATRGYHYHAAPRYDDKRTSRGSAIITPIAEQEDEDRDALDAAGDRLDGLTDAERKLKEVERVLMSPDPFLDGAPNPLRSHPVSPEFANEDTLRRLPTNTSRGQAEHGRPATIGSAELPTRTVEAGVAELLLHLDTSGRVSPSKSDERTSSTLSEQSHTSVNSITRTMSTRTGALLAAALAARATSNSSPQHSQSSSSDGRTHTMSTKGGRKSPCYYQTRARSSTNGSAHAGATPHSASIDADSFTTARTNNFAHLQNEGEALLGGRPTMDRDDPYQRALAAHASTREPKVARLYSDDGPPPPIPPRRRIGWMGSLRRALNAVSMGERSFSLTGSTIEQYADDTHTTSSSPTKGNHIGSAPRRAVSDGGALLEQKRGEKDWEDSHWPRYRDDADTGDWGDERRSSFEKREAEQDWDVEGAASKRDVQVMFTVPKARLRVVNADMDRASLRSASDGALSRSESVKALRREESIKTLRVRSEWDRVVLPATVEEDKVDLLAGDAGAGGEQLLGWSEKEKAA